MKLTEVTAVAVRIIGILMFMNTFGSFVGWIVSLTSLSSSLPNYPFSKLIVGTSYFLLFLIVLILIKFPITVAKAIVPTVLEPSAELEKEGTTIQYAAFVILGVYLISKAMPDFIYNLLIIFAYKNSDQSGELMDYYISGFVTIIEFAVGAFLVFRSNGLIKFIYQFRRT